MVAIFWGFLEKFVILKMSIIHSETVKVPEIALHREIPNTSTLYILLSLILQENVSCKSEKYLNI